MAEGQALPTPSAVTDPRGTRGERCGGGSGFKPGGQAYPWNSHPPHRNLAASPEDPREQGRGTGVCCLGLDGWQLVFPAPAPQRPDALE